MHQNVQNQEDTEPEPGCSKQADKIVEEELEKNYEDDSRWYYK